MRKSHPFCGLFLIIVHLTVLPKRVSDTGYNTSALTLGNLLLWCSILGTQLA